MVPLTEQEIIQATGGTRLGASPRASYESICTDTRALRPGCLFVALKGERFDGHQFVAEAERRGAAAAIVEKGKASALFSRQFGLFEVDSTLKALGDLARFHRRRFKIPVGAITGSSGKTTTKEMVHAVLSTRGVALKTEGNLNNEIGVPLTLFRLEPLHVAAVIEMGMSHPGEISRLTSIVEPGAALITGVHPAHLQGLGTLEGVAEAKGELFRGLKRGATAVVNLDDPLVAAQSRAEGSALLTFGEASSAQVRIKALEPDSARGLLLVLQYRTRQYPVRLAFLGRHNARNAAAAFALGLALGYEPDQCVRGLEQAGPYPGRLTPLDAPGGITILDDTYNANPASMAAALDTLGDLVRPSPSSARDPARRAVVVIGDMLELGSHETREHSQLGKQVAKVAALAAFFGPRSLQAHQSAQMGERAAHFEDLPSLTYWLKPRLRAGDVVLVKASRGMRMERVVQELTGAEAPVGDH
jgi:UDP-N-acetylmuramoyl-tripeptide--D-alanyl-D-alanine ligase